MTIDRDALLERLKKELGEGRADIRREFEAGVSGPDAAASLSRLIDHIFVALHDAAIHGRNAAPLAVVAVGGYGRGELAPYSDVDLLFLLGREATSADQAL
ncbi:MAG: nucleotidyltransferase domain-containing protein, partial [Alphaproteobacteria bacterium]